MNSLDNFARTKLRGLEKKSTRREIHVSERHDQTRVTRRGKTLISFCCNDYLNFSHHADVKKAAQDAIEQYGAGAGASRLITGNHPLIHQLEKKLAQFKGTEDACVFSSGYMANIGIIPSFIGPQDIIFLDELSHACLFAGARLSGAAQKIFRHNDMAHLEQLLEEHRKTHTHAMILTDGIFSMDGDLAPLDIMAGLAEKYDAWLMSDDAHGIGILGRNVKSGILGRTVKSGSRACFDPLPHIPLQMGTLSKALGSFGGYLCASRPVIDLIKTRARSLIFTTALPPASAAAALKALQIIEEDPEYCQRPVENARIFCEYLNLPTPQSPIVPIIIGAADTCMAAAAELEDKGFLVTGIRPPTVPQGTARLRITFCARHQKEDILRLAQTIQEMAIL